MSDLYDRIEKLCKSNEMTITTMCKESGASRASLSDLKVGRKQGLSTETLSKIAKVLGCSVGLLIGEKPEWEYAIDTFGFCWNYAYREEKKATARSIVNNLGAPLADRIKAQIIVFQALFSRSLESSGYDLDHVDFDTYVAMLLDQGKGTHNIPSDIYDALVERYGKKPGMPKGTYYKAKKAVSTLTDKSGHGSTPKNMNILRIAGRDGSYEERYLTDGQLAAVKAIIDQLPDASEDL